MEEFSRMRTPHDRLAAVVERGKQEPQFTALEKSPDHKVPGCLSNLWFLPEYKEGLCFFRADSDSAVVKGVAVLLCQFYSGQLPSEVIEHEPTFLKEIGITQHLSSNRRNGLTRIRHEMVAFALKHFPHAHT
ncbi:MAG: SufE family protein [Verrucomicrobiales bacterium]